MLGRQGEPLRNSKSTSGPIIKPQWFDLIDDPVEEWDLMEKRLDCAWVLAPVARCLGALQQSVARYPNIKPGQEFTGYMSLPVERSGFVIA